MGATHCLPCVACRKIVSNKGMSFDISGKGASFDASGKHSRVTSFELDLSDETVAEDVAIIKVGSPKPRHALSWVHV